MRNKIHLGDKGIKTKSPIDGAPIVKVSTSWCVDDVRNELRGLVDNWSDEEILDELHDLSADFHDRAVASGWDVIQNCFWVTKKETIG